MMIVRVHRPVLFQFKAGQFAYLKFPDIDSQWHPFSIASSPLSSQLEFYIEVRGQRDELTWTRRLWNYLKSHNRGDELSSWSQKENRVEIMGPCGTSLEGVKRYTHGLTIGTGTGVVPLLSLFNQHVQQLLSIDPLRYMQKLKHDRQTIRQISRAEAERQGSLATKLHSTCRQRKKSADSSNSQSVKTNGSIIRAQIRQHVTAHNTLESNRDLRSNLERMKMLAFKASRSIYGTVLLSFMPMLGVALIGVTISWNTLHNFDFIITPNMIAAIKVFSVVFQALFAGIAMLVWDANGLFFFIDATICLVFPVADWFWFRQYSMFGYLPSTSIALSCLTTAYLTFRCWNAALQPCKHHTVPEEVTVMERLDLVWITRSAGLVGKVLPDLDARMKELIDVWGENTSQVIGITIHVTDPDEHATTALSVMARDLECPIAIEFKRPDLSTLLEQHTLRLVTTCTQSQSLLAYCGSSNVAAQIQQLKVFNDMLKAVTGHKEHMMECVFEDGGTKPTGSESRNAGQKATAMSTAPSLAIRRTTYFDADFENVEDELGNIEGDT